MKTVLENQGNCGWVRSRLDDQGRAVLTAAEEQSIQTHLDQCDDCAAEQKNRERVRTQLRGAVHSHAAPAGLEGRIRAGLRDAPGRRKPSPGSQWLMAAAAAAVLVITLWVWNPWLSLPAPGNRAADERYTTRVFARIASIFHPGLGDHLHCSILSHTYPDAPPPEDQLEVAITDGFKPLIPLMKASLPEGYRLFTAHECRYRGRRFVHFAARRRQSVISLIITRKQEGESFQESDLKPVFGELGAPIYAGGVRQFQVAGFETGGFLAYIASDMDSGQNLELARSIATPVRQLLESLAG